jgi:hypothetical protein
MPAVLYGAAIHQAIAAGDLNHMKQMAMRWRSR